MQGIFSFTGPLVDWNNLEYPIVDIKTYPWRWEKTNPQLGCYLSELREHLLPYSNFAYCKIKIPTTQDVCIIPPGSNIYNLLPQMKDYESVIYVTKWPSQQLNCSEMSGIFQYDENQECPELFKFAEYFDTLQGAKLSLATLRFIKTCSTSVLTELKSYIERLKNGDIDFSRIQKHKDIGEAIATVATTSDYSAIHNLVRIFEQNLNSKYTEKNCIMKCFVVLNTL